MEGGSSGENGRGNKSLTEQGSRSINVETHESVKNVRDPNAFNVSTLSTVLTLSISAGQGDEVIRSGHKWLLGILAVLLAFLWAGGCALWQKREDPDTSQEGAFAAATYLMQKKKYEKAGEAFKRFKEDFPLSEYTPLAELRGADAVYLDGKYAEAIVLYEEFKKLHPTHEEIPYASYQLGMCHYRQIGTLDRDQSETEKAIERFRYVVQNYPRSSYAEKARTAMQLCLYQLADHELYVGRFYFKAKKYKAALGRFQGILQKYPGMGYEDKIRPLAEICLKEMDKEEKKEKEKEAREEKKKKEREEKQKAKEGSRATPG